VNSLKSRKGNLQMLGNLAIGIAALAIALVVTFLVISQGRAQIVEIDGITNTSNVSQLTTAYNATITLGNAVATIPPWVPLIVIAVIGGVLLRP
jgi:hypothetical protein